MELILLVFACHFCVIRWLSNHDALTFEQMKEGLSESGEATSMLSFVELDLSKMPTNGQDAKSKKKKVDRAVLILCDATLPKGSTSRLRHRLTGQK